jgi:transketolase C-terminal domain/subunit
VIAVAYTGMKVRVLAHHAGIPVGFNETSHHAITTIPAAGDHARYGTPDPGP